MLLEEEEHVGKEEEVTDELISQVYKYGANILILEPLPTLRLCVSMFTHW